jgi:hypothetical protein
MADEGVQKNLPLSKVAHYSARACLQLSLWDKLETYTESIDPQYEDSAFYASIVDLVKGNYDRSKTNIKKVLKGI